MVLQLRGEELLRLSEARGAVIEVLEGRVWITEHGSSADLFLGARGRYCVGGTGLVLVSREPGRAGEAPARIQVHRAPTPVLAELGDHLLRDIGLRRDQLPRVF